jgi:chromate transporter
VLEDFRLWLAAGLGFACTLAGAPFWIPLIAGGLICLQGRRPLAATAVGLAAMTLTVLLRSETGPAALQIVGQQASVAALFVAGLKGGLLTFGGAYTAIPYLRADTVGRGWLADGAFLDGVALASVLPAPLIIFGTFAGYVAGGWGGALAVTAGIFLPAFAFSLIFFERLEAVVDDARLHRLLVGVAGAVVGVIAATCLQLGWAVTLRTPSLWGLLAVALPALAAAWLTKGQWATPLIVIAGGCAGYLLFGGPLSVP